MKGLRGTCVIIEAMCSLGLIPPLTVLCCRAVKIGKAMGLEVTVLSTSESKR